MFYHAATDQYIQEGVAFVLSGIQYPSNWLNLASASDKEAAGLVEVSTSGTRADEKLFYVTEELVNGVRVITNLPKPPEVVSAADAAERESELIRVRALRSDVLDRLAGIAGRAQRKGDIVLAAACDTAAEALLDITVDLPSDAAGTKTTIEQRYRQLALAAIAAAPSLANDFAKVDL